MKFQAFMARHPVFSSYAPTPYILLIRKKPHSFTKGRWKPPFNIINSEIHLHSLGILVPLFLQSSSKNNFPLSWWKISSLWQNRKQQYLKPNRCLGDVTAFAPVKNFKAVRSHLDKVDRHLYAAIFIPQKSAKLKTFSLLFKPRLNMEYAFCSASFLIFSNQVKQVQRIPQQVWWLRLGGGLS